MDDPIGVGMAREDLGLMMCTEYTVSRALSHLLFVRIYLNIVRKGDK